MHIVIKKPKRSLRQFLFYESKLVTKILNMKISLNSLGPEDETVVENRCNQLLFKQLE